MSDCAAPRHHDQPQEAAPHARLCRPCTYGLRTDLRQLPHLHAQLGDILDPSNSDHDGAGDGLHYNEPAFECRSQIERDLAWWTVELTAVRAWALPASTSVPALAGWLHAQVHVGLRP